MTSHVPLFSLEGTNVHLGFLVLTFHIGSWIIILILIPDFFSAESGKWQIIRARKKNETSFSGLGSFWARIRQRKKNLQSEKGRRDHQFCHYFQKVYKKERSQSHRIDVFGETWKSPYLYLSSRRLFSREWKDKLLTFLGRATPSLWKAAWG